MESTLISFLKWLNAKENLNYTKKGIEYYVQEYLKTLHDDAEFVAGIILKNKIMKDQSFHRFFNPQKSPQSDSPKLRGRIVWDSKRKGTYIRAKHGDLSNN